LDRSSATEIRADIRIHPQQALLRMSESKHHQQMIVSSGGLDLPLTIRGLQRTAVNLESISDAGLIRGGARLYTGSDGFVFFLCAANEDVIFEARDSRSHRGTF
jgi:hypothetical protein